jgi:hypothetical protein
MPSRPAPTTIQSTLTLFPVIPSFQILIQAYDNDHPVTIKKAPGWPIADDWICVLFIQPFLYAVPPKMEAGFVAGSVHRVILAAYLIADDTDERGLLNYEYGKTTGIYSG